MSLLTSSVSAQTTVRKDNKGRACNSSRGCKRDKRENNGNNAWK